MTYESLHELITERKKALPENSTTTQHMTIGLESILPKLNEEVFEVAMALEHEKTDDVALEVSQCYYHLLCLAVFLGEPFDSLQFKIRDDHPSSNHEFSKALARVSASICQTPCLKSINHLSSLLIGVLKQSGATEEDMFKYL